MEVANTRNRRHATFPAAVSAVLVVGALTCTAVSAQESGPVNRRHRRRERRSISSTSRMVPRFRRG